MHIRVNGTDHDVPDACSVADLLREIGLFGRPVAVAKVVRRHGRQNFYQNCLQDGRQKAPNALSPKGRQKVSHDYLLKDTMS